MAYAKHFSPLATPMNLKDMKSVESFDLTLHHILSFRNCNLTSLREDDVSTIASLIRKRNSWKTWGSTSICDSTVRASLSSKSESNY